LIDSAHGTQIDAFGRTRYPVQSINQSVLLWDKNCYADRLQSKTWQFLSKLLNLW